MISVVHGDITKIEIEAIVNAANSSLLGGSGVDGAIHRAGGKSILEECKLIRNRQGKCKVGHAVITNAGKLMAKKVIHTVGPVWTGGINNEEYLLKCSYQSSLALASNFELTSIAFPNISTGIYKFPKKLAATIAISTVQEFARSYPTRIKEYLFVCYEAENYHIYKELLKS